MATSELTKDRLLAKLKASGRAVTGRQLERWWKAGEMDRPARRHIPGVRGSVSVFLTRALDQAALLYDAAGGNGVVGDRRLNERVFMLWWNGRPVSRDPRSILLIAVEPLLLSAEKIAAEEPTPVESDVEHADPADLAFDKADAYVERHRGEKLAGDMARLLRRNLRKNESDMFSVLTAALTLVLGGRPALEAVDEDETSLGTLLIRAFGGDTLTTSGDALTDVLEPAELMGNREGLTAFVGSLSDEEISTARKATRSFFDDAPIVFEAHAILFGRLKLGDTIRLLARLGTSFRASATITLAYMSRLGFAENIKKIVSHIEEATPRSKALCAVVKAFPEFKKLLLVKNAERLAALPEETREKMLETISQFVKLH